jgi:hypothetical protein
MNTVRQPNLTRTFRALERALYEELLLVREMRDLMTEQHLALIAADTPRVQALAEAGTTLVERQRLAEWQRIQAVAALTNALGIATPEGGEPSLSDLLPALGAAEAQKLTATRDEILAVHRALDEINEKNHPLIENALETLRLTMDAMNQILIQPARYGTNPVSVTRPAFYIDRQA